MKKFTKVFALFIALMFSVGVSSCEEKESVAPDTTANADEEDADAADYGSQNYSLRKIKPIACIEKDMGVSDWLPRTPYLNDTYRLVISESDVVTVTKEVEFVSSVSIGAQASLASMINANASIASNVSDVLQTQTVLSYVGSLEPINVPPRMQARMVLKGLYYRHSAQYYNKYARKWIPITFDKFVTKGWDKQFRNA
jgi:hypothetical protein